MPPPSFKVKESCYNSLVRTILEYDGCTAWYPYMENQIYKKLELINKRAARFITGNHLKEHGNNDKNMWTPRRPTLKD